LKENIREPASFGPLEQGQGKSRNEEREEARRGQLLLLQRKRIRLSQKRPKISATKATPMTKLGVQKIDGMHCSIEQKDKQGKLRVFQNLASKALPSKKALRPRKSDL
jgi:hypothetical protein